MPRFFSSQITPDYAHITGADAWHIAKVLRMRTGEKITVCDLAGTDYHCELAEITPESVRAKILDAKACENEMRVKIRLYQALPKADKLEFIVQKAVELGVCEIAPVQTERCVVRWEQKSADKKIERLQKIALEAAKQSGRGIIPQILPLCSFENAITGMNSADCAILFYENATMPLHSLLPPDCKYIAVMIGCEGGFSPQEAAFAAENKVVLASLGKRILRCETAPVAALAAIGYAYGEF